jgi:hypothetical protein
MEAWRWRPGSLGRRPFRPLLEHQILIARHDLGQYLHCRRTSFSGIDTALVAAVMAKSKVRFSFILNERVV